jgi:ectoine hydroxylase-related dioxygenase (phytanoyl-CoA dioxygenase family)
MQTTGQAVQWITPTFKYDASDHQQYESEGYRFLGKVLADDGIAAARENLDRMVRDLHPSLKPDEIYSAHQQENWLLKLATCKPLLDVIEPQIGPNIVLWSTHLICKPPKTGRPIPWHQDETYWDLSKLAGSIWLAFDDVDEANGTMFVLPEWHKRGFLKRRATGNAFFREEIDPEALPPNVDQLEVGYFLKAGEAAGHHTMMPHRSTPNLSDRWRRVMVCRFMSADGKMGKKEYPHWRTAKPLPRKYILARGEDVAGRGLERI